MAEVWRLLDTGLRPAAENIALNRALLEARAAGEVGNTLRFLRFMPSALVGFHQNPEQELDLDYCRRENIAVQRRLTGGGAIYFDASQLGWELYCDRRDFGKSDLAAIARVICEAAAKGISRLGVAARFRPRNDIEVAGRKISGTGGVFEGDALLYQGTLLIDVEVERLLRVLRLPVEKLADKAIASVRERVVSLAELLGARPPVAEVQAALVESFSEAFGVRFAEGGLTAAEEARFAAALKEIDDEAWVHGLQKRGQVPRVEAVRKFPGGLVRVGLAYDRLRDRVMQIQFTGDFFVSPRRAIFDLEARLRDVKGEALADAVQAFLAGGGVDLGGLAPTDFAEVAREALQRART
ncbi:MAG: lipoate--protein ligase family protein [Burkholderiales bacterium]|nr:lipoate--protein ligase family protein [Burkholderiales bacterium]